MVDTHQVFEDARFLGIPGPSYAYDAVRDRFLLVRKRRRESPGHEVHVIFGWFEELERLAPGH